MLRAYHNVQYIMLYFLSMMRAPRCQARVGRERMGAMVFVIKTVLIRDSSHKDVSHKDVCHKRHLS